MAKSVSLVAVKVLDADGAGTTSQTIDGLEWGEFVLLPDRSISNTHSTVGDDVASKNLTGKAVVNMSLSGPSSTAVNQAIAALTRAGITCVVAAGNEGVCLAPSTRKNMRPMLTQAARRSQRLPRVRPLRHHRRCYHQHFRHHCVLLQLRCFGGHLCSWC